MKTAFTAGTKVCPKGNQRGEVCMIVAYEGEGFYLVKKPTRTGLVLVHEDDVEVWEGSKPFWRGGKDA